MKTFNTLVLFICCLLVFTNCGTTNKTTTTTTTTTTATPPRIEQAPKENTISPDAKEKLKAELSEEIKIEIRKEMAAQKEKEAAKAVEKINEPMVPTKPIAKPAPIDPDPGVMEISTAQTMLQGSWRWIETRKSIRGVGNQVNTPASMGFQKTANFKEDGTCEILLNNISAGNYNYKISSDGIAQLFINFSSVDNNTQHMEDGPLLLEESEFEILGTFNDLGANIKFERKRD